MARKRNHGVWLHSDGRVRIAHSAAEAVAFQFDGWRLKPAHTAEPAAESVDEPAEEPAAATKSGSRTKSSK